MAVRTCFKTEKGTELPLLNLKNKEYLQVPWRVVWFREEKPDWSIETEIVLKEADVATMKATIKDQNGRVMSTSHKTEDRQGFFDFLEKAETGAIGRALALIGYGTQFSADELDEGTRIVDSPLGGKNEQPKGNDARGLQGAAKPAPRPPAGKQPAQGAAPRNGPPPAAKPRDEQPPAEAGAEQGPTKPQAVTDKQLARMHAIKTKIGWTDDDLRYVAKNAFGITSSKEMTWIQYNSLTKLMEMSLHKDEVIERLLNGVGK